MSGRICQVPTEAFNKRWQSAKNLWEEQNVEDYLVQLGISSLRAEEDCNAGVTSLKVLSTN